jgi:hypothetical protein
MPRRITALDPYYLQLLPCPFCGTTLPDIETHDDYHIVCPACLTYGPLGCTEEEAVCLWNARMPVPDVGAPRG